jgi:hypothetical protein
MPTIDNTDPLSAPLNVRTELLKQVGDHMTDQCLAEIASQCLSLLQSVRRIQTICLTSYDDATASTAMLATTQTPALTPTQTMQSMLPPLPSLPTVV